MEKQFQHSSAGPADEARPFLRALKTAASHPAYLVALAALIIGAGLYLNWATVVALGFAPLVLTLAPCALMCALGICAKGGRNQGNGKPPEDAL